MKKNLLKHWLLSAFAFTAFLLPSTVLGQDKYWFLNLDDNQGVNTYLNTVTGAITSYTGFTGYYPEAHIRTVFDALGNELFSYGKSEISYNSNSFGRGGEQVFPIPGSCKEYYLLRLDRNLPHVTPMSLAKIDASISGQPVILSTVGLANLDPFDYGAVAGKLNGNGNRRLYFLTRTLNNNATCDLSYYNISPTGSVSSYTLIQGGLPKCSTNALMKLAPDGNSMAYTDANGQMVTINLNLGTVTSYGKNVLGMAGVTVSGTQRWYVSTDIELGYFDEGNPSSFTLISNTSGINSDVALGQDGNLYVVNGNPASTTGTLAYFSPSTHIFNTIPGAQIKGINKVVAPTAYSFGNHVEGEDTNVSQVPASVSFTLNGITGSFDPAVTPAPILLVCPSSTIVPLSITVNGQYTSCSFNCEYGTIVNGIFTPSNV